MVTLKQIKAIHTLEQLEALNLGRVICDISHRGGGLGFWSDDVAKHFKVLVDHLPNKYGAGCNYLGGGIRGSIFVSGFSEAITGRKAQLLKELGLACVRVYKAIEDEQNLNDELSEDDQINWEAMGTNAARKAGIKSAY